MWLFLYLPATADSGDFFPIPHFQTKTGGAARASPEELAERHLSLVVPIARSFKNRLPSSVDFDDLVGAGNLGLVEAARRFDPARGTSFGTFAKHRIRGAITDSLRRLDPVSRPLRSRQKTAERATRELMASLQALSHRGGNRKTSPCLAAALAKAPHGTL